MAVNYGFKAAHLQELVLFMNFFFKGFSTQTKIDNFYIMGGGGSGPLLDNVIQEAAF